MKRFLLHIILFLVIVLSSCLYVISLADGTTDPFYLKFTTPKQKSLVLGSSRAAQAIQPHIFNAEIINAKLFNYSFTLLHSPYGKSYFESIKRKIDLNVTDGTFIISVNPWIISSNTDKPNDSLNFRELGANIDKTYFVNLNPNFEYILESFHKRKIKIITNKSRIGEYENSIVHINGWLEVQIYLDSLQLLQWEKDKLKTYQKKLQDYSGFSSLRFDYLKKTITFLQKHGNVYLVRIPVSDEMLEIESQLVLNFNDKMFELTQLYNVKYINVMPYRNEYQYTDGHHLDIESGKKFTTFLAQTIKQIQKSK